MFAIAYSHRYLHASSLFCTDELSLLIQSTMPQSETKHEIRTNTAYFRKPNVDLLVFTHPF